MTSTPKKQKPKLHLNPDLIFSKLTPPKTNMTLENHLIFFIIGDTSSSSSFIVTFSQAVMLENLGCVRFSDHSLLPGVGTYLKGGTSFKCSIEGAA